ncbi:MAG: glycosyltransferase family 2 protein [Planctomycetota bacterium]|nr:MAG: glycosyltransferase family 2 protein [Planctomycetota bacterium]
MQPTSIHSPSARSAASERAPIELSIVVLSWNTRALLAACLDALQRDCASGAREILVVDNASRDGSADMVARDFPAARLVRHQANLLYARGNNSGARAAVGRYLCLLNSDTEVRPGALERLTRFLEQHPEHAAVAPKLVDPDGGVQRACTRLPTLLDPLWEATGLGKFPPGSWLARRHHMADFDHEHSRDVAQPPGACFVMRRAEFLALGGFDPRMSLYFNDVDLCRRLRARGRRIHYLADAVVLHHGGGSTRTCDRRERNLYWIRNRRSYYLKHHGRVGAAWVRAVVGLWGLECAMRIRLGPRAAAEKRAALAELRDYMRECARA